MDLFNRYRIRLIEKFGVDESDLNSKFENWRTKFGDSDQAKRDFIWSQSNQLINEAPSKGYELLHYTLLPIYFEMVDMLHHEKKSYTHIIRLIHNCHLENAANKNYRVNILIHAAGCCPECEKYEGRVMPIHIAIQEQLIPFKECSREKGCICFYAFPAQRDSEGNFVRK